jgi:hypothetical protein
MHFAWLTSHTTSLWVFLAYGVGGLGLSCAVLIAWLRRSRSF